MSRRGVPNTAWEERKRAWIAWIHRIWLSTPIAKSAARNPAASPLSVPMRAIVRAEPATAPRSGVVDTPEAGPGSSHERGTKTGAGSGMLTKRPLYRV
jgi:hypothetical protein